MGYYLDAAGNYYEGDKFDPSHQDVPKRPSIPPSQAFVNGSWVAQPVPPASVTMRQARLALLAHGNLATVNNAIAAMTGASGDAARITWEFSSAVERNHPLVAQIGTLLSMNSAALDALFIEAAAL